MEQDLTRTSAPSSTGAEGSTAIPDSPPGYELLDEIGRGGMGVVYRACDVALNRDVAVKLLSESYPPESPAALRFLSEARITGQLQHPGIPAVHQVGTLPDGRWFLAMKLIKGNTLSDILKQRTDVTADRGKLLAVFEAVCQAVGYAHAHHVIHRDLKPANIMVGAFGEVQVMDWGLAKVLGDPASTAGDSPSPQLTRAWTQISPVPTPESVSDTQAGSMIGTPAFIPPEQALGEVGKVDERADVFGLGALLAVILTGKPPYVGESYESLRVQAARGKLDGCYARLDDCAAEPELVALCKKCLAFEPVDRPRDGGAVAQAVAELRAAADDRARQAEVECVRVEGEKAMAEARSAERRKRRRLAIGAATVLTVAVVAGLTTVLAVQRRANAELAAKNSELADEQARALARFEIAQKAVATLHTGVSEDMLLKNDQFKELRTKLLNEAATFYADLERLLEGQTDTKSRKALAAGYFQLAELTYKIGSTTEAVSIHRKALAIRRELAAVAGADLETRLDVATSLGRLGWLLNHNGDYAGALSAFEEQRALAEQLATENPTEAIRYVVAQSYGLIGLHLHLRGKPVEALAAMRKAQSMFQKLADDSPANSEYQHSLSSNFNNIGHVLRSTGKPAEALEAHRKARAIHQKLADKYPAVGKYQMHLAGSYNNIGWVLWLTGKPAEALEAQRKALAIRQKLVDDNPAVSEFQSDLAWCLDKTGNLLLQLGELPAALEAYRKAMAVCQKMIDSNPDNLGVLSNLAEGYNNIGRVYAREKRYGEALTSLDSGMAILQKQLQTDPDKTEFQDELGCGHAYRGAVRVRAGQPVEAAADLRRAIELWTRHSQPYSGLHSGFHLRLELARLLALLAGLGGDPKSGVSAAEAATFADQAVATLRDAIKAGWAQFDELKQPDFDSIRDREDFQNLRANVAKQGDSP